MNFIKNNKYILSILGIFLIIAFYANIIATKKYNSRAVVFLQDNSDKEVSAAMSLLGMSSSNNSYMTDIKSLEEFIHSYDFFLKIDKKFNLKKEYTNRQYSNFYEKLSRTDYKEDFLQRFANNLVYYYDPDYNVIDISYISYSSNRSANILNYIIKQLEIKINKLNHIKVKNNLKFIKHEVVENLNQLNKEKKTLKDFQNEYNMFDPQFKLEEKIEILNKLKEKLLDTTIILKQKTKILSNKNPSLIKLKNKYIILKNKVKQMEHDLYLGRKNGLKLNDLMLKYKELKEKIIFRNKLYNQSLLKRESIKLESIKKNKILEIITEPTIEDKPYFPNNMEFLPMILILLSLSLFIIRSAINIIKEHKD